jgi:hypoxanthine phosphoribosyltransferase
MTTTTSSRRTSPPGAARPSQPQGAQAPVPTTRLLLDAETIARRVRELGARITADYRGRDLVVIPVLKGAFVFAADLVRAIDLPLSIDFLALRSYEGSETSGVVEITSDLSQRVEGRDLLIVEDIVDTGLTMTYLRDNLETRRPRSVRLASLLHKPARTRVPVDIDYLGFSVDDVFVVGYGLDHDQRHRNLPYLAVVAEPGEPVPPETGEVTVTAPPEASDAANPPAPGGSGGDDDDEDS